MRRPYGARWAVGLTAAVAGLAALLMALFRPAGLRNLKKDELFAGAALGLFMFGGYAFQTAGLQYTTPAKSGFVTGSSVVLVPLLLVGDVDFDAGLAVLQLAAAGDYRVSVDAPVWIDAAADGKLALVEDYQGLHSCDAPHKIVEFKLAGASRFVLQLSGAAKAAIRLTVTQAPPRT